MMVWVTRKYPSSNHHFQSEWKEDKSPVPRGTRNVRSLPPTVWPFKLCKSWILLPRIHCLPLAFSTQKTPLQSVVYDPQQWPQDLLFNLCDLQRPRPRWAHWVRNLFALKSTYSVGLSRTKRRWGHHRSARPREIPAGELQDPRWPLSASGVQPRWSSSGAYNCGGWGSHPAPVRIDEEELVTILRLGLSAWQASFQHGVMKWVG